MTALAGSALLFSGCQEGDNPIDFINDNETRGAVLRTIEIFSLNCPLGIPMVFSAWKRKCRLRKMGIT